MEKSVARAKYVASRRDRRRFSRARRSSQQGPTSTFPTTIAGGWDGLEDLEEAEEPKSRSQGFDYEELLAQDPLFSSYTAWSARRVDLLEDELTNIYSLEEIEKTSAASILALDLDRLAESLSRVSLEKRLFLEEEDTVTRHLQDTERKHSQDDEALLVPQNDNEAQPVLQDTDDALSHSIESVDVSRWLNQVLQDPEDGTPVHFEGKAEEAQQTIGGTEEELDELLNMLDTVTMDEKKIESVSMGGEHSMGLLEVVDAVREGNGIMSQQDLDVLFWAPGEPKPCSSSPKPGAQPVAPPGPEDDFDAWLDGL